MTSEVQDIPEAYIHLNTYIMVSEQLLHNSQRAIYQLYEVKNN